MCSTSLGFEFHFKIKLQLAHQVLVSIRVINSSNTWPKLGKRRYEQFATSPFFWSNNSGNLHFFLPFRL